MALKTPIEYVESLRALKVNAYIGNEKVDSHLSHFYSGSRSTRRF